jgi:biotin synthase
MDVRFRNTIDSLKDTQNISKDDLAYLLECDGSDNEYLYEAAREVSEKHFHKEIYLRGLIEFSNYCRNNCYYCGIRGGNLKAERYRLTEEEILSCCDIGEKIGFKTFVLQSGEDPYYTDELIADLVKKIKTSHPDCAVTLSIGEKSHESYQKFFDAGADRYLLRHETANEEHYSMLHPESMSGAYRKQCLFDLKEIGFQVGCGIMVGSPGQTMDHVLEDLYFMARFQPHMVGIGPFIPHKETPFADEQAGTLELTLYLLSIIRLMLPTVLLPATTALGTIDPRGRELGILAGANVVMPNLSPVSVRKKYDLYDNKICTGEEAAECMNCLKRRIESIGYEIVTDRGDNVRYVKEH